jgi:hypothetical protein
MLGYPVFRVPTETPGPTSGEAVNPQVGLIFWRPLDYFELFTRQSTTGPREVPELEVQERPPSTLRKHVDGGPPKGVGTGGPEVSTINAKKHVDGGPPGGAGAGGPKVSTINVKKHVDGGPPRGAGGGGLEVGDVDDGPPGSADGKVRQQPPPKLKTSMAGPLGSATGMSGSGHHQS